MKVRMRITISGSRDGEAWPKVGEVVDLPDDEAVEMLQKGHAAPLEDGDEPETATARKATTRPAKKAASSRRKPKADAPADPEPPQE